MLKFHTIILSVILVGGMGFATVPFISHAIDQNTISEISVTESEIEVYPGQTYSISPLLKNKAGEYVEGKTFEYISSNTNIVSFNDVHSGVFKASEASSFGDSATVTVKYENLITPVKVNIKDAESNIISATLNDVSGEITYDTQKLTFNTEYVLSLSTYPASIGNEGVTIDILDNKHQPIDNFVEVRNNQIITLTMLGVGSGYISIKKNSQTFDLPFTSYFKEQALNTALLVHKKTYSRDALKEITNLIVEPIKNEISLAETDYFSLNLLYLVNNQKTKILDYKNRNFDILLRSNNAEEVYKQYEEDETIDKELLARIYPASNTSTTVLTVVYYYNVKDEEKYKIMYYESKSGALLAKPEEWVQYKSEPNNQYWYYDELLNDKVDKLGDIEGSRIKLFAKFEGAEFTITFKIKGDVYQEYIVGYNGFLTDEQINALSASQIEQAYPNTKFYRWVDQDNNEFVITDKFLFKSDMQITAIVKSNFKIVFDANGGTIAETEKDVLYNSSLSFLDDYVPTRANCVFDGWYNGSQKINASDYFNFASSNENDDTIHLSARWHGEYTSISDFSANPYTNIDFYTLDLSHYNDTPSDPVITIKSTEKEVHIIGKGNAFIESYIKVESRSSDLLVILDNISISAPKELSAIDTTSVDKAMVTFECRGTNNIAGSNSASGKPVTAVIGNDLTFTGDGSISIMCQAIPEKKADGGDGLSCRNLNISVNSMSVNAGNGVSGASGTASSLNGASGTKGGNAITVENEMHIFENGSLHAVGGAGGAGGNGADGVNKGANAFDGKVGDKGGNGGNGGDSGYAIKCGALIMDSNSTISAASGLPGNGGNGGKGNNGGNGGNGEDGKSAWYAIGWFYQVTPPTAGGNGGNGGNGGAGGKGGNAVTVVTCNTLSIAILANLTIKETTAGRGGAGGNGGTGGNGGVGGHGYGTSSGDRGANGRGGTGGNGGSHGSFGSYGAAIKVENIEESNLSQNVINVWKCDNVKSTKNGDKGMGGCNGESNTPVNPVVTGTSYSFSRDALSNAYEGLNINFIG